MERIGNIKFLICFIYFLISGQLYAQNPSIELKVDKKTTEVGDFINLNVTSNIGGNITIQLPDVFVSGGVMNGMSQTIDQSGRMVTSYTYSQQGMFKKEGTYLVYAQVKDGKGKTYKSEEIKIVVKKKGEVKPSKIPLENREEDITKHNLKEPIFGVIQKSKEKIYEGEPLILAAKVYSRLNINMLQSYEPFSIKGSAETFDLEKTENVNLNRENFKGNTYLTFTCGRQLVFPSSPGKYIIRPFEMVLHYNNGGFFDREAKIESNANVIEVLPLPTGAPKDFTGGVGKFSLFSKISSTKAKVGDVIHFTVTIKGTGNLQGVSKPKFSLPSELKLYGDPEIKEELEYSDEGVSGERTYTYHLKVISGGEIRFPKLTMSYFDPKSKKYITLSEKEFIISSEGEITKDKIAIPDSSFVTGEEEILVDIKSNKPTTIQLKEEVDRTHSWNWFLLCIVSILLLIVAVLWKKKKEKPIEKKVTNSMEQASKNFTDESNIFFDRAKLFASNTEYENAIKETHLAIVAKIEFLIQRKSNTLSPQEIKEQLIQNNVSDEMSERINKALRICEESRFALFNPSESWEKIYELVKQIV
jgi:hypothetical protein